MEEESNRMPPAREKGGIISKYLVDMLKRSMKAEGGCSRAAGRDESDQSGPGKSGTATTEWHRVGASCELNRI